MTDISITAADVIPSNGARTIEGVSGGTITAGQVVYLDTATNTYKLADADDTAAKAVVAGIALNAASAGQPVTIQVQGTIDPGGTVVVGEIYVLSGNAGGIAPEGDLASGDYVSIIGVGTTAALISLFIKNSGVQVPA